MKRCAAMRPGPENGCLNPGSPLPPPPRILGFVRISVPGELESALTSYPVIRSTEFSSLFAIAFGPSGLGPWPSNFQGRRRIHVEGLQTCNSQISYYQHVPARGPETTASAGDRHANSTSLAQWHDFPTIPGFVTVPRESPQPQVRKGESTHCGGLIQVG